MKGDQDSDPDHRGLVIRSMVTMARSLGNSNFRTYMIGQGLSQTGLWMQQTAELWLILELTGSGTALGVHSVLRFGPLLIFGVHAGLLTDRFDRRRLLLTTQALHAIAASILAVVAWVSTPSLGVIYALVFTQGVVNAVDNPLRRAFVRDLVSDEHLANAISLKSSVATVTKTGGPALGGLVLAVWGAAVCFTVNALSYAAVLVALLLIDRTRLRLVPRPARSAGQLREGFRYSWQNGDIRVLLVLAAAISTFAWNWNIVLPVLASTTFSGDAALYGSLVASIGFGSFVGAVNSARRTRISHRDLSNGIALLVASLLAAAVAPNVPLAFLALACLGATSTSLIIGVQSRLQLMIPDAMSGRILALYSVAFAGSKPAGGVLAGWMLDLSGPRLVFGVGATVVGGAAILLLRNRRSEPDHR